MLTYPVFCSGDLDPMTLMYEHDLDIVKIYPHTKNELYSSTLSKVMAQTGQTDATEHITVPYLQVVNIHIFQFCARHHAINHNFYPIPLFSQVSHCCQPHAAVYSNTARKSCILHLGIQIKTAQC